MKQEDILKFYNTCEALDVNKLYTMREELHEEVVKMICNNDLIEKIAIIEKIIQEKENK